MQKLSNDPAIGTLFRASSSSSSEPSDVERAIDMFASNPGEAMKRYGHRADIMNALRAFAGHFGEHLGKMGDLEEEARKVASEDVEREAVAHVGKAPSSGSDISEFFQIPNDLPEHERVLVRRVLSDKDVKVGQRDL